MANQVTTAGVFGMPIPLPNLQGSQNGIVAGPDGAITEYPVLTRGSTGVFGIAAGPDNNIWFVESANGDGHICYLTI